jgi:valyl-tRNA synthetase
VDNEIPFHDVMVHPTVQDVFGLRMSKSLGTGIDPMGLIETYGADATRFGLLQLATGAQDVRFIDQAEAQLGEEEVRRRLRDKKPLNLSWDGKPSERYPQMQSARNFANKIWNASRFVLSNAESLEGWQLTSELDGGEADLAGRWIVARLRATVTTVTQALDNYQFDVAANTLYSFIWNDFCDWFVELSKPKLREGDAAQVALLVSVLESSMRLLHPFMPFLSEEIWQRLPNKAIWLSVLGDGRDGGGERRVPMPMEELVSSVCVAPWPQLESSLDATEAERDFALVQDAIRSARNLRAEAKLPPSQKLNMTFVALNENARRVLEESTAYLTQLANLESASILTTDAARPANALSTALAEVEIHLPLEGLIDVERETARLQKELDTKEKDLARIAGKLGNPQFTDKAPREVVEKEEAKSAELTAAIEKLRERLQLLN